jgi:hypothetical protein
MGNSEAYLLSLTKESEILVGNGTTVKQSADFGRGRGNRRKSTGGRQNGVTAALRAEPGHDSGMKGCI